MVPEGLHAEFNPKAGFEPIGKSYAVPREFTVSYNGDDVPYIVELTATWSNGRLICTSLRCQPKAQGEEITLAGLRTFKIEWFIRASVFQFLHHREKGGWVPATFPDIDASEGPTDANLEWTAVIYRFAYATRYDPTIAVMEALDLPRSTAARWVMTARKKGLLGPTVEGRAGEMG